MKADGAPGLETHRLAPALDQSGESALVVDELVLGRRHSPALLALTTRPETPS